jgi:Tfp pilus assembly major pilin PilA
LGSGIGVLLYVYVIGVLAAIAIPAYQDYTVRAALSQAIITSQHARDALSASYQESKQIPSSLASVGIAETAPNGLTMRLDPKHMILTVQSARGILVFTPREDSPGHVVWKCTAGSEFRPAQLPTSCK